MRLSAGPRPAREIDRRMHSTVAWPAFLSTVLSGGGHELGQILPACAAPATARRLSCTARLQTEARAYCANVWRMTGECTHASRTMHRR